MSWVRGVVSPIQRFTGEPLSFMRDNLVVVPFEGAAEDTKDEPLDLVLYTLPPSNSVAKKQHGGACGLYFITMKSVLRYSAAAVSVGEFKGYFCPYKTDNTLGTVISNKADMMFTAAMDGCSFGIGSEGAQGERLVYHSNLAGMGSASDQSRQGQAQDMTLRMVLGGRTETVFSPADYRTDSTGEQQRSTTFGLRDVVSGKWSFYSQTYTSQPGAIRTFVLKTVTQIA